MRSSFKEKGYRPPPHAASGSLPLTKHNILRVVKVKPSRGEGLANAGSNADFQALEGQLP
jgi:hypothetical protein